MKIDPKPRCCYDAKKESFWQGYAYALNDFEGDGINVATIREKFGLDKEGIAETPMPFNKSNLENGNEQKEGKGT